MIGKRHPMTAQQGRRGSDPTDKANRCSQKQLYSIPQELCDAIAQVANRAFLETDASTAEPIAGVGGPASTAFISEVLRVDP